MGLCGNPTTIVQKLVIFRNYSIQQFIRVGHYGKLREHDSHCLKISVSNSLCSELVTMKIPVFDSFLHLISIEFNYGILGVSVDWHRIPTMGIRWDCTVEIYRRLLHPTESCEDISTWADVQNI